MYIYTSVHVYVHICIYIYMCICIHVYISIHTYIHVYIYIFMYTFVYIYICICMYIYLSIYIYTYTSPCTRPRECPSQAERRRIGMSLSKRNKGQKKSQTHRHKKLQIHKKEQSHTHKNKQSHNRTDTTKYRESPRHINTVAQTNKNCADTWNCTDAQKGRVTIAPSQLRAERVLDARTYSCTLHMHIHIYSTDAHVAQTQSYIAQTDSHYTTHCNTQCNAHYSTLQRTLHTDTLVHRTDTIMSIAETQSHCTQLSQLPSSRVWNTYANVCVCAYTYVHCICTQLYLSDTHNLLTCQSPVRDLTIHMLMGVGVSEYLCVCVCVRVCACVHMHTVYIYTRVCIHVCACECVYIQIWLCVYI